MSNLLIGLKRFLKNKNTVTILALLLCVGLIYAGYNWRIKKATEPIDVPYAIQTLSPRTQITSEMVGTRKVAGKIVTKDVILNTNEIIDKYVSNQAEIPSGSIFYKSTVIDWKDMPTSLTENIPDGNTIVSLPVTTETTYGNSIFPGNYIDLYYVGTYNGKTLIGKFIESIKVLSVTDSAGNNVFEQSSNVPSPSYLIFSVPEDMHLLLKKALYLNGTIFPVPRNAEYSKNPKATVISSTQIQQIILSQTVNVSEKDLNSVNLGGN